ncbi:MAG: OmpA family protein [Flavobacteriales bacterium]|nr:OmpA family protein [Flavobacteriales bacterium]
MRSPTLIAICCLAAVAANGQEHYEVRQLDIRPSGEDYAPVAMDSGFVMCSIRENASLVGFTDAETGKPLSDLYWVPFKDGRTGTPVLFSANLATPVNEGPASFAENGRIICFTRNQVLPKKLSNMRRSNDQLGLFFSHYVNGAWQAPEPFPHNHPAHSIVHPAFSADGQTLYFASDMPGGLGGMDLYRCARVNSGWSAPENLGPEVNSTSNEVYPRWQVDGTLSFASDRIGGLGGLDIYITEPDGERWIQPTGLPEPVNTSANDHGYMLLGDRYSALFASDRSGRDAIHLAKRTVPKFRDCAEQKRNNYCYSFRRRAHAASAAIPVDHYWDMGDGTRIKGYHAQHCYSTPGNYEVRSLLIDRKSGDLFHALSSNHLEVADQKQAWIAAQDTVRTGRKLELDGTMSYLPGMKPAEHHWDMGDGTRGEGIRVMHAFRQAGIYQVKLDVLSMPDEFGVISNRCNTKTIVVLDRFKDQEDMSVVATYQDAYGKTHAFEYQELPFDDASIQGEALNDVVFSVQLFASKERVDLDDARFAQIRRHYRVIERFDPIQGAYTYSVGETKNAEELYQVFKKVKELQFLDAEVFALRVEQLLDLSQLDLSRLEDLNHKKLRTNAIHFAYKSADLSPGSDLVLEQISALLRQHPELQLVIEAHTDDIGSRQYNMGLSQQRAASVVRYLAEQGVEEARLIPIGHGKNQPIASNKTEEGRSQNRRVEFRMVVKGEAPRRAEQLSGATPKRGSKR